MLRLADADEIIDASMLHYASHYFRRGRRQPPLRLPQAFARFSFSPFSCFFSTFLLFILMSFAR
jgi:hypothetical protein